MRLKSLFGSALACMVLIGLSIVLFGTAPARLSYIGWGADPEIFFWFLNWYPFAWAHHLDPFWTHYIAAPSGMSLAWRTSIPALGLIAAPFTHQFGALAAYNGLMRLAPGLAGIGTFWAARELTNRILPSLGAGLIFGFSPYEMGQSLGHLDLNFVVAVPFMIWAVLRAAQGKLSLPNFAILIGVLFAFQFGVSQEIAASFMLMTMVSVIWIRYRDPNYWGRLKRLNPAIIAGLVVAFVVSMPFVFAIILDGERSDTSIMPPIDLSTDLLNFVIPTPITFLFGPAATPIAVHFIGNFSEESGYLGVPLIALLCLIAFKSKDRKILLPLELGVFAAILSLGPWMHVAGDKILWAPWIVLSGLPILHDMLPARFMLYAWLGLSLGLAAWLARPSLPKMIALRYGATAVALLFCVPDMAQVGHWTTLKIPAIFTDPTRGIPAGENVLVLPFVGDHIGEQYVSGLRFRLVAQGYLGGGIARPFSQWPLIMPLYNNAYDKIDRQEFATFLAIYNVQEVLIERDSISDPLDAAALVTGSGWKYAFDRDGVDVYVPGSPPPLPAKLADEQAGDFMAKRRAALENTLERRERMNVCSIRGVEDKIGLHPAFIWSFYQKHFDLPLPVNAIVCRPLQA